MKALEISDHLPNTNNTKLADAIVRNSPEKEKLSRNNIQYTQKYNLTEIEILCQKPVLRVPSKNFHTIGLQPNEVDGYLKSLNLDVKGLRINLLPTTKEVHSLSI